MMHSSRKILWLILPLLAVTLLFARQSSFDAESDAGTIQDLDKINLAIPLVDAQVRSHPAANSYRVRYAILPDPVHPRETLPREITFNRRAAVLRWSREFWFEQYDGVSDQILRAVAAKKGGVRMLLRHGCRRTFPPR